MKFKVNDRVEIICNSSGSINKIGDIGIITEIDDELEYKVTVGSRQNELNWHNESDLKLMSEYPKEMYVWDKSSFKNIKTVLAYVPELSHPYIVESIDEDCVYIGYKHAEDIPQEKELTMQEIADKFNISVDQLKIKK